MTFAKRGVPVAQVRTDYAEAWGRWLFVREGLRDLTGRWETNAALIQDVELRLKAVFWEKSQDAALWKGSPKMSEADAAMATAKSFEAAFRTAASNTGFPAVPVPSHNTYQGMPDINKEPSLVEAAWKMATFNAQVALQSVVIGDVLEAVLRESGRGTKDTVLDALARVLWTNMQRFVARRRMLAIVAGDHALAAERALMAQTTFSDRTSVMEYLTVGGMIPGSWPTEQEDAFRKELAEACGGQENSVAFRL